jgi:hypothetical protein
MLCEQNTVSHSFWDSVAGTNRNDCGHEASV